MRGVFLSLTTLLLFISGCSSKNYFEPEKVESMLKYERDLNVPLSSVARDGATYKSGNIISNKRGLLKFRLPKGFRFVNDNGRVVIAADNSGNLTMYDNNGNEIWDKKFDVAVSGASYKRGLLALIFANNKIALYDTKRDKEIYKEELEPVFALDSRVANPIFVNDLIIFPTLDGRLLVMDMNRKLIVRDIALSNRELFNNVIYLKEVGGTVVAATAYKVISVSVQKINSKRVDVKDLIFDGEYIYIFTKSGKVIKCDKSLKSIKELNLPFAVFSAVSKSGGYLYAIEKSGYLIKIDSDLNGYSVYQLPQKIDKPIFVFGDKLFIDRGFLRLK
jgi:hypothetical protein